MQAARMYYIRPCNVLLTSSHRGIIRDDGRWTMDDNYAIGNTQ
jgi:hypothetical protein